MNPVLYLGSHIIRSDLVFRKNSGLYAVHYARSFSGSEIAFRLRDPNEVNCVLPS